MHLVDGSTVSLDLTGDCVAQLHRVVNEVQLSFAAAAAPLPPPPPAAAPADTPRSSMSSDRSNSSLSLPLSAANSRRTPSSLLLSLLSPLLPNPALAVQAPPHVAVHQQPARAHRRQARSLLVDAYRRYVLPLIKDRLPSAYLLWSIQSETATKMDEFTRLRDEIYSLLEQAGVDPMAVDATSPLKRYRSACTQSSIATLSCESESSSRRSSLESTESTSPQTFLLSIPPAHTLPLKQRVAYSAQLTRLTQLASRIGSITKLASRYEREEGKRRWLEQLDLSRDADKACRRAFSNGLLPRSATLSAAPLRRSSLRQSITAEDIEREARFAAATATAALEDILEAASDDDEPDLSDSRSSVSASPEPRTPTTQQSLTLSFDDGDCPMDSAPALILSHSDDSLSERDEWETESEPEIHPKKWNSGRNGKQRMAPIRSLPASSWRVEACN